MKRLIWKELREMAWWSVGLMALPSLLVAMGHPLSYRGGNPEDFAMLWPVGGFLFGAAACSRELAWDTARFAYSRPIRWWQLWAVKLSTGLAICIASVVIPAIAYRLTCAHIYLPFADFASLARASGGCLLMVGIPFICGFGCSVVLPGLSLTIGVGGVSLLLLMVVSWIEFDLLDRAQTVILLGVPCVLLAASLVIAPRLTHPAGARVRLFSIVLLTGFGLLCFLNLPFPEPHETTYAITLSSNRQFVAVVVGKGKDEHRRTSMRLRKARLRQAQVIETGTCIDLIGWLPNSTNLYYLFQRKAGGELLLKTWDAQRQRGDTLAKLPFHWPEQAWDFSAEQAGKWSPSGKRVLFFVTTGVETADAQREHGFLFDVGTHTLKEMPKRVVATGSDEIWWASEDELAAVARRFYFPHASMIAYSIRSGKTRTLIPAERNSQHREQGV